MRRQDYLRQPIKHLDLASVRSVADLVEGFRTTSFQSRNLARCFDVYQLMLEDQTTVIFLGLSGALVPGGMRKVIKDMIASRLVDVVVTTGANLCHDVYEALGTRHYVGSPDVDDRQLDELDIDRIYDTYANDILLGESDLFFSQVAADLDARDYSSREYLELVGRCLDDRDSILATASRCGVPVYCPAINDSGIGIGLTHFYAQVRGHERLFSVSQIRDNYEIMQIKQKAATTGAVYLGGGVPKNYIQQIAPMLEMLEIETWGHKYAIQITTDDPKWGGLSGSTLSESVSWGKLTHGAQMATVYVDATIGLPLLIGALLTSSSETLEKRVRRRLLWEGDTLVKLSLEDE